MTSNLSTPPLVLFDWINARFEGIKKVTRSFKNYKLLEMNRPPIGKRGHHGGNDDSAIDSGEENGFKCTALTAPVWPTHPSATLSPKNSDFNELDH